MLPEPMFSVGACVRVKGFNEMLEEYGGDSDRILVPGLAFVDDMAYLCGKCFHIKEAVFHDVGKCWYYLSEEEIEIKSRRFGTIWYITDAMLDLVDDEVEAQDVEFSDLAPILGF